VLFSSKSSLTFDRIELLVTWNTVLGLMGFAAFVAIFYYLVRHRLSEIRKHSLNDHLRNLIAYVSVFLATYAGYILVNLLEGIEAGRNSAPLGFLGFGLIVVGSLVVIKASRILILVYLFLGNSKEGVPLLIVNIFTLLLTIGLSVWFANNVLGVKLVPLLATSAVFSLVLGLALQDTLGNLFSGVALRIDAPYDIGDWIEVFQGNMKFVGQVEEITWRATTLLGLADEQVTISNRTMGQAEIYNFSKRQKPFWRSQFIRVPFSEDLEAVRLLIFEVIKTVPEVRPDVAPIVVAFESTDSWVVFRCSYCIEVYDQQWIIGSKVFIQIVDALKDRGFLGASQRVELINQSVNRNLT